MKKGGSSIAEHKGSGVQGKTYKKVDGEIYGTIYDRRSGIIECGEIAIAKFDEDTSSSKCKPDSEI